MKRPLVAALVIGAVTPSLHAAEVSWQVGIGTRAEWLSIAHDASSLSPLLGSPTSILAYDPIVSVTTNLGATIRSNDVSWLSLELSASPMGGGDFVDSDFAADGILSSRTFSTASLVRDLSATGRLFLSDRPLFPYAIASLTTRSLAANGLACGTPCTAAPAAASSAIIRQDFISGEVGFGATGEFPLSSTGHVTSRLELTFGYAVLEDSHFRRVDLGPVPNINSQFLTASIRGELGYSFRVSPRFELGVMATAALTGGIGQTEFGPASNAPTTPVPAFLTNTGMGARLSLLGRL